MSGHVLHSPRYRADIDGLRAVAVISVVAFHAGIPGFAGGFFGVDVFFVISGFLITRQILPGASRPLGEIIGEFYLRRARRILPALCVMLIVVTSVACWLLLPRDLEVYGRSLALSTAFLGNLAAGLLGGYFETGAAPLGHLWSLGVEEQFYLVYPLLLVALARWSPRRLPAALAVLAASSLLLSCLLGRVHPYVEFLLTPSRGWELLLGACIAVWTPHFGRRANDSLALLSLVALLGTLVFSLPFTIYPGWHALLPCAATAMLIVAGERGCLATTALSMRPLVAVGLASYSLYLWHMPVFSFVRYFSIREPSRPVWYASIAFICLISMLSYLWIETPIRHRKRIAPDRRFLAVAAMVSAVLVVIGVTFWATSGLPQRFSQRVRELAAAAPGMHPAIARCTSLANPRIASGALCRFGSADSRAPRVVVWGDSHAMVLLNEYERIAKRRHLALYLAAVPACRPLTDVRIRGFPAAYARRCEDFVAASTQAIARLDPALVILNGFWKNPSMDLVRLSPSEAATEQSAFEYGVAESMRRIDASRRRICVVFDPPVLDVVVPYTLAMTERFGGDPNSFTVTVEEARSQQTEVRSAFTRLALRQPFTGVDLAEPLCRATRCLLELPDGTPLYNDSNHLSAAGARLVGPSLEACFDGLGSSQ